MEESWQQRQARRQEQARKRELAAQREAAKKSFGAVKSPEKTQRRRVQREEDSLEGLMEQLNLDSDNTQDNGPTEKAWESDLPRGPRGRMPEQEQWKTLKSISCRQDRALQRLLFQESRFQFTLMPHQFIAVRKAAGVPDDFPCHVGSRVKSVKTATMEQACHGLLHRRNTKSSKQKGLCLADAMGLGKTVEAIAGAILANLVAKTMNYPQLPTLIVSPNDTVELQWKTTLMENGVRLQNIVHFDRGKHSGFKGDNFVLMSRYTAMAEMREVWSHLKQRGRPHKRKSKASPLFPNASEELLTLLAREFNSKNQSREDGITQLIAEEEVDFVFRMVIVDEAHFLKNRMTYWTIAIALACKHAHRTLPLTGTPYQNRAADLASLLTLIDPTCKAAKSQWWKDREQNLDSTKRVLSRFVLRRGKDEIADKLTQKSRERSQVSVIASEISMYEDYESSLMIVLRKLQTVPESNKKLRNELFQIAMAVMSSMRMSLIHPLVPGKGRELTSQFSPSRRKLIINGSTCRDQCVCCQKNMRPSIPVVNDCGRVSVETKPKLTNSNTKGVKTKNVDDMMEGEEYDDDEDEAICNSSNEKVHLIPRGICRGLTNHYAHQRCLNRLKREFEITGKVCCQRCLDLGHRAGYHSDGSALFPCDEYFCKVADVPGCPNGFVGSPKLKAVVQWILDIPRSDKMIILSFFKGSLDLLEGILHYERGMACARFDGDVNGKHKQVQLDLFKTNPSCRVLLMTVQSGGVGLNITEANHVAFLDRWYNPFVHEQAEDRCHRIGQRKDCHIKYFDANATIDEAMFKINTVKSNNAEVLLSDGYRVGTVASQGQMTYVDLTGLFSALLRAIKQHRSSFLSESEWNKMLPIPSAGDAIAEEVLHLKQRRSLGGRSSFSPGTLRDPRL